MNVPTYLKLYYNLQRGIGITEDYKQVYIYVVYTSTYPINPAR